MQQPVARVAALVVAAALAAGCSDEGDETGAPPTPAAPPSTQTAPSPTPTPQPPKSDYAEKADAICGRYQEQIDEIPAPATDAELVVAMQQTIPLVKAEIAELRKLKPPAG